MMPSRPVRPEPDSFRDPEFLRWRRIEAEAAVAARNAVTSMREPMRRGHRWVASRIGPVEGPVLDLGCCFGDFLRGCDPISPDRVLNIDADPGVLRRLAEDFPGSPALRADLLALPFRNESLRSIVSLYTLEHLPYLEDSIEEIVRVLVPGGRLAMAIPAEGGLLYGLGRRLTTQRFFERQFGIDYARIVAIEHCNTAAKVLDRLDRRFRTIEVEYWPARIPWISANVLVFGLYERLQD